MSKLTDLPAISGLASDDLLYVVDQPSAVSKKATVAQFLSLVQASIPTINVLDYGALGDGTTDDTTAFQNALNAAYDLGVARLIVPKTAVSRYMFSNTVFNTSSPMRGRVPTVTSVNTTTDTITFDSPHLLATGDSVRFRGYAWGGITLGTQYFVNKVSATDVKLYNTKANAITGGATGLIDCTTGVTTTGSITNGSNQLTVTAVLAAEKGTCVRIAGVSNPNGEFFTRSIAGSVITLNANANATVSGAAVTYVSVMDWADYRTGIQIEIAEGVSLMKATGFSGSSILAIRNTHSVVVRGGSFYGLTPDDAATISAGDDLLSFASVHMLYVAGVKMFNAGDAAFRCTSSPGDPIAATATFPEQGIGTKLIWVERCYTRNCHQWSTTTNDYMHGGASEVYYDKNVFENLRGSCKLASRTAGATNVFLTHNIFKGGRDKGFEIDSYANVHCQGNIFKDIVNFAFYMTPNNGPAASPSGDGSGITGFAFNYLKLIDNWFIGGASTGSVAPVRFAMDIYSDGFLWDYDGVEISRNHFIGQANTSCFGISWVSGSPRNFRLTDNQFINFSGAITTRLAFRGNNVSGFINNVDVSRNTFNVANATATVVYIIKSGGGSELLNEIHVNDNKFYGTFLEAIHVTEAKNVFIEQNRGSATGAVFFGTISGTESLSEVHLNNNKFKTTGTVGANFNRINGLYLDSNIIETASGTTFNIDNSSSNVWFDPKRNRSIGGTANFRQVPINSNGLGATGRNEFGSAIPTSGTWNVGDRVFSQAATSGQPMGFQCTVKGTAGTISGAPTGTTNGTTNVITVSAITSFAVGAFINIAGAWTGGRTITAIGTTTITVDGGTPTAVSNVAVTYVAPTFVNMANLA